MSDDAISPDQTELIEEFSADLIESVREQVHDGAAEFEAEGLDPRHLVGCVTIALCRILGHLVSQHAIEGDEERMAARMALLIRDHAGLVQKGEYLN